VPEVDVAAALAVVAQGETPLLLQPEPERSARFERERRDRDDRDDRGRGARGDRPGRDDRGDRPERRRRSSGDLATYRIAVGRRHKVEPRQIVGALANEGGLSRDDFGVIQIRPDFSLVELPADLPGDTLARLENTRISGRLIELRLDRGAPRRSGRGDRDDRFSAGPARDGGDDRPARKPRHKTAAERD